MTITPIRNLQMMSFGGNPIQNFGTLVITALAVNAFASFPVATAKEASNMNQEICEVLCAPLPGDKNDTPEQLCQETCRNKDGTINKIKDYIVDSAGKYKKPLGNSADCLVLCTGSGAKEVFMTTMGLVWDYYSPGNIIDVAQKAASIGKRSVCAVMPFPACMACCGAGKYFGKI